MNKYRVLIAEDEPLTARYIQAVVEQTNLFVVVAVCESGEEALAKLHVTPIEVLITDIKMTGMSGIVLLQQSLEVQPQLRSVIISGYSTFEFAKEAISLHVEEYILKPIDNEKLLDALHKVYKDLEKSKCNSDKMFFAGLNRYSEEILGNPAQKLPFSACRALMVAGSANCESVIHECWKKFCTPNETELKLLLFRNSFVVLGNGESRSTENALRVIAKGIQAKTDSMGNTGTLVLQQQPFYGVVLEDMLLELYHFQQRHFIFGCIQILAYNKNAAQPVYDMVQEKNVVEQLLRSLSAKREKEFYRSFGQMFDFWEKNQVSLHSIKQAVYCIVIHLYQIDASNIEPVIAMNRILQRLYTAVSYKSARDFVREIIEPAVLRVTSPSTSVQSSSEQMHLKIVKFLMVNVGNNYSLQEISDIFGISQPYVSKLFRMYSGISYKEYVTSQKITAAIKMMESDKGVLIKDVAEKVGYDQLYFSAVFYRIMGEYPKQYREKIGRKVEDENAQEPTIYENL